MLFAAIHAICRIHYKGNTNLQQNTNACFILGLFNQTDKNEDNNNKKKHSHYWRIWHSARTIPAQAMTSPSKKVEEKKNLHPACSSGIRRKNVGIFQRAYFKTTPRSLHFRRKRRVHCYRSRRRPEATLEPKYSFEWPVIFLSPTSLHVERINRKCYRFFSVSLILGRISNQINIWITSNVNCFISLSLFFLGLSFFNASVIKHIFESLVASFIGLWFLNASALSEYF